MEGNFIPLSLWGGDFFDEELDPDARLAKFIEGGFTSIVHVFVTYEAMRKRNTSMVLAGQMKEDWTESVMHTDGGRKYAIGCRNDADALMAKIILESL